MSNPALTENSVFPVTRKYTRGMQSLVSGDYTIKTSGAAYWGTIINSYIVYFKGERLAKCSRQCEAKTVVEMHDAGFGTNVKFYNIPKGR